MKGVIILPQYLSKCWVPKQSGDFSTISTVTGFLFYSIKEYFGFDIKFADEVDVPLNTDIVMLFGVPYHNRPNLIPGLLDLDKNIKLVIYPGDIQCYDNPVCLENKLKVFNRADLIVSGSYEYFAKLYPQFLYKYEFLPLFFSPHNRYVDLSFNATPIMKCLVSGSMNPEVYPLRVSIKNSGAIDVEYRPATFALGDDYAKLLNYYFCCIATSSIFNYAVAKYFEIPAAGSLLLANDISDLRRAGFVANKHYVPITKTNVLDKIKCCLKNPFEYENIRKEGMKFVRENHSVNNRVKTIEKMFKKLLFKGEYDYE